MLSTTPLCRNAFFISLEGSLFHSSSHSTPAFSSGSLLGNISGEWIYAPAL